MSLGAGIGLKMDNAQDVVYEFVCRNRGLSTYIIAKKLKMSGGRVRYALHRLHQMDLVSFKFERFGNPRIRKLTYPVEAVKLVPKSLRKELKNLK